MRIGIDARMYSSSFTGIGRYVHELTRRLFQIDQDHEWVLFMNDPEYERFQPPHKRVYKVRKVRTNARHYSWREQVDFARQLYAANLDLMHFTHFNAPLLYRRPSVVTIHDLTLSFFPGKKMRSPLHRLAYHLVLNSVVRRSVGVVAVSQHTAEDLKRMLHVPNEKLHVIYEAVAPEFKPTTDASLLQAVRQTYDLRRDFILYTGVWRDHKNLVRLLEAFAVLCRDSTFDGDLVLTGRSDPHYPEVEETIQALGLGNRVKRPGLVPETHLLALYSLARFYVLPSLYEGFGLSPLEAMACGTPVAASNTSCIPEICGKDNAAYFDPYHVEGMARALKQLWQDPALRRHLTERGFEHVKDFSWDRMAKETLSVYNESLL